MADAGTIVRGENLAELDSDGQPGENQRIVQLQLDELNNHPALLMWCASLGSASLPRPSLLAHTPDVCLCVRGDCSGLSATS